MKDGRDKKGKNLMISFKTILPVEQALTYQNKMVEYVCKSVTIHPALGKLTTWRGALETEYFSVMFVGGILVVSVVERELHLGHISVSYSESESLIKATSDLDGINDTEKDKLRQEYNLNTSKKEQDEITFDDVMLSLNWNYVPFAKIDENILGE